jgi:pyruvate kinase
MPDRPTGEDDSWADSTIKGLIKEIERVRSAALKREAILDLGQFGDHLQSARNLVHYLAMRRFDLRTTQERLATLGVSSLGQSEGHVLYNLDAVLSILYRLAGLTPPKWADGSVTPSEGTLILERNSTKLLGPTRKERSVRIMVTMPLQAATDYDLVRDLLASGMDCMRINCAHDSESDWVGMISNLRRAEKEVGRTCRILMDIAGPRLRTGPLKPGPQVVRIKPKRDELGRVVRSARVWLTPKEGREEPPQPAEATLPLPREFLVDLAPGAVLRLRDARGSKRALFVESRIGDSFWATSSRTAYVMKGTVISSANKRALVGDVPYIVQPISLQVGDILVVSGRRIKGRDATRDAKGRVKRPAIISCSPPRALATIRRRQPIWFDDGKIGGIVVNASTKEVKVRITNAAEGGSKLQGQRGINLPKTELRLPPVTRKDITDLEFITKHADLVGYSFLGTAEDVDFLRSMLAKRGRADLGIILKIETLRAFEQLPSILLAAIRAPLAGAMIARGDLAVECGFERLSEVQEEILWLCEAGHIPTIWATQVLEGLTKNGIPSRAEVSDAAMGERAECVMLNKGPFMIEAVKALDSILERMQAHQAKKSALLRHLNIAGGFLKGSVSGRRALH